MGKRQQTVDYWLTDEGLDLIRGWCRRGLTNEQIAHNMGIGITTLTRWRKKHGQLESAIKTSKDVANILVENALFKRAIGYDADEITSYRDKESGEMIITKRVQKHYAPDVRAISMWLMNRLPQLWRNRPDELADSTETQLSGFVEALAEAVKKILGTDGGDD
jgi:hypothetical protein